MCLFFYTRWTLIRPLHGRYHQSDRKENKIYRSSLLPPLSKLLPYQSLAFFQYFYLRFLCFRHRIHFQHFNESPWWNHGAYQLRAWQVHRNAERLRRQEHTAMGSNHQWVITAEAIMLKALQLLIALVCHGVHFRCNACCRHIGRCAGFGNTAMAGRVSIYSFIITN